MTRVPGHLSADCSGAWSKVLIGKIPPLGFYNKRRGEIVVRATITEKTTVGVVFLPWHFAEAAANLLTNDALDPQALIPEFKACAVQVFPARESDLPNPEVVVQRGRY